MFAGCMVTMLLVQAIAFSPMVRPTATWFIALLFLIQGFGLVLIPLSGGETGLVGATAAVAASGGLLAPLLAYWLSYGARKSRAAAQLGLQSAAASIGQNWAPREQPCFSTITARLRWCLAPLRSLQPPER